MLHPLRAPPPILQLDRLCLRFPAGELLANLSADVPSGVTLVRGGESRGKTSLLRIIAGDLPFNAGTVRVNGIEMHARPESWRQQVFWVNPRTDAFDALSPVEYFNGLRPVYAHFDGALLQELVDSLAITPHLDKPLYMLSTGSRRKVWLAAALASGPPVTLLDEPFAALDTPSIARVKQLLTRSASHPTRALLVADYEAPSGVPLASTINLGD